MRTNWTVATPALADAEASRMVLVPLRSAPFEGMRTLVVVERVPRSIRVWSSKPLLPPLPPTAQQSELLTQVTPASPPPSDAGLELGTMGAGLIRPSAQSGSEKVGELPLAADRPAV